MEEGIMFTILIMCLIAVLCGGLVLGVIKLGFALILLFLKLAYVICIGLPLGILLLAVGLVLCITIIGYPLGKGFLHLSGSVMYPF